jgi:hypothetical protein
VRGKIPADRPPFDKLRTGIGSTVALTAADGSLLSQQRYLPFGGTREMPGAPLLDHTDLTYTGQCQ